MSLPAIDLDYCKKVLVDLLNIPSPTGFTDWAVRHVAGELETFGVTSRRTHKGALLWTLRGGAAPARAVATHIDTLGAMVKEIKSNGRLKLTNLGGYDWATVEGEYAKLHTLSGDTLTGTVVNIKQSTHVFGSELRNLKRSDDTIELRLDAEVHSAKDVRALGVEVGDFVSWDSRATLANHGFVKGRHLDNKAAVAIALATTKALCEAELTPASDIHFFVSNYEEVGHGAAAGIPDVDELLCIDMAAVGDGQTSDEYSVSLCVKDSSGPYDYEMNRSLRQLAKAHDIDLKIDIYPYYGSDASAAWAAGGNFRAALIGPGVDASHAYERTHEKALAATTKLLCAYCLNAPSY